MDTRKLAVKHSNDTTLPFPTSHVVVGGQAGDDLDTIANYVDPEDAAELVRRWNAHNALVEALEAYKAIVGNTGYSVGRDTASELYERAEQALEAAKAQ
jgi:hypothetical protein